MKKILFAIPTLGGGGAERVLVTLINNLDQKKYDITLFSVFDDGINKKYLNENIHYRYFFKKIIKGNIHLLKFFSPEKLYKTMIKDDYDIIISYLEGITTRIVSGCTNENSKLLNWVHTEINHPKELIRSYRNMEEMIRSYNQFNATIFVSNTARKAFENTFKDIKGNMLVKYNTVDTDYIVRKSKEKIEDIDFNKNKINLISVGRFTRLKGYIRLLNIIKMLIEDKLNVHLFLLGKGELEEKYREIIKRNGISDHVTILGYKDNPYKYVKNCDLFVCSSYKEGYSTAVTESLIVGTPVVTTLCSGMEEILGSNNEYGLITDNNDEALYQGIKSVLSNLNYYKNKATERGETFSTEKTIRSLEEVFDSL
ncbi:glycosyltransferase [Priestia endophytica]|uniref:glycosyltransferase n=1 Tax=Priestia endophytica TaxID=135735 RepID=UPI000DCA3A27|nr:glycosyltransferase [Priestia endophytica]RAS79920.1 glycosyl transferase [Priestia endophytica]